MYLFTYYYFCDTREVLFIYWYYPFIKSVSYCISPFIALAVHSFNKAVSILENILKRFCHFTMKYRMFHFLFKNAFQAPLNSGDLGTTMNKHILRLKDNKWGLSRNFPKLSLKWICTHFYIFKHFSLVRFLFSVSYFSFSFPVLTCAGNLLLGPFLNF